MKLASMPPPLNEGDRVGVAALSGPVEATALEAGAEALRGAGLEPVLAANLGRSEGPFAGRDEERLHGFMDLAGDPDIKAIFFARGGHGILRVLPALDWEVLSRHPRAYLGYSDVTPFLNLVVERLGLIAFHGPMVAVEWADGLDSREQESMWKLLSGDLELDVPVVGTGGRAQGVLKGGCLSLIAATAGTEFSPRLDEAVLFFEDVAEPLYRLDRMLTQLRLSGSLAKIKAMVAGRIEPVESDPVSDGLPALLADFSRDLNCPAAWDLPSGHSRPNITLPLGARVRLDAEVGSLRAV
ncbi:MAG: LD-carboxypeptidase [Thermoanaerobaculia bacterium]